MKRILSLFITLAMVVSAFTPVMAKDTENMKIVLEDVKKRIMDTSSFDEFSSESYDNQNKEYYSFAWDSTDGEEYKSLNLSVTKSGIIYQYHYYEESFYSANENAPTINKMSQNEALEKTKLLIKELNPDIYPSLRIEKNSNNESLYDDTYYFLVKRYENEIPVYQDTGYVSVNSDATKIISFGISYTEGLVFEDKAQAIDTKSAWEYFKQNAGMDIEYRINYEDDKKTTHIVYLPKMENDEYISAVDGQVRKIVSVSDKVLMSGGAFSKNEMAADMNAAYKENLTDREIEELETVSGLMSEGEAVQIIKNTNALDFDPNMELTSTSCYKGYDTDDYFYRLGFTYQNEDEYKYANAVINAKTGEIISWSAKIDNASDEVLSKDILTETTHKYLVELAPEYFRENYEDSYLQNDENVEDNRVSYTRYVNGIVFKNDTVDIRLNPENKKVNYYRIGCTDIEFASADNIISKQNAQDKLSEQAELVLYYIPVISNPDNKEILSADVAKLGYMIDELNECLIDADTGELIKNQSEEDVLEYTDIEGHYAEQAIKTLAKFGIGFDADKCKPDDVITQQEFASLLVSTFFYNTPVVLKDSDKMYEHFNTAKKRDIIKEADVNPDEALTREMAAVYTIRAMGAEKYAQLSDIYKPIFADVKNNLGYINILAGMGVISGDGSKNFNPNNNLTRADALIMIYNYLKR